MRDCQILYYIFIIGEAQTDEALSTAIVDLSRAQYAIQCIKPHDLVATMEELLMYRLAHKPLYPSVITFSNKKPYSWFFFCYISQPRTASFDR